MGFNWYLLLFCFIFFKWDESFEYTNSLSTFPFELISLSLNIYIDRIFYIIKNLDMFKETKNYYFNHLFYKEAILL